MAQRSRFSVDRNELLVEDLRYISPFTLTSRSSESLYCRFSHGEHLDLKVDGSTGPAGRTFLLRPWDSVTLQFNLANGGAFPKAIVLQAYLDANNLRGPVDEIRLPIRAFDDFLNPLEEFDPLITGILNIFGAPPPRHPLRPAQPPLRPTQAPLRPAQAPFVPPPPPHYQENNRNAANRTNPSKKLDGCTHCGDTARLLCMACEPTFRLCWTCTERCGREAHVARYFDGHQLVIDPETSKCSVCRETQDGSFKVCVQCEVQSNRNEIMCHKCYSDHENVRQHRRGQNDTKKHRFRIIELNLASMPEPQPFYYRRNDPIFCGECKSGIKAEFFRCVDCDTWYNLCDRCADDGGLIKHETHNFEYLMATAGEPPRQVRQDPQGTALPPNPEQG